MNIEIGARNRANYVDALTERIMADLKEKCVRPHLWGAARNIVRLRVSDIFSEIQHRIRQDAIANLEDLNKQLVGRTQ